jgi:hypothetical protein
VNIPPRPIRNATLILVCCLAGVVASCKKEPEPGALQRVPPPADQPDAGAVSASTLPGASEILAAIDKKDYDGAMRSLMKLRRGVKSNEQMVQFQILASEAKMQLLDASATDPKAAQAANAIRAMTLGR